MDKWEVARALELSTCECPVLATTIDRCRCGFGGQRERRTRATVYELSAELERGAITRESVNAAAEPPPGLD